MGIAGAHGLARRSGAVTYALVALHALRPSGRAGGPAGAGGRGSSGSGTRRGAGAGDIGTAQTGGSIAQRTHGGRYTGFRDTGEPTGAICGARATGDAGTRMSGTRDRAARRTKSARAAPKPATPSPAAARPVPMAAPAPNCGPPAIKPLRCQARRSKGRAARARRG